MFNKEKRRAKVLEHIQKMEQHQEHLHEIQAQNRAARIPASKNQIVETYMAGIISAETKFAQDADVLARIGFMVHSQTATSHPWTGKVRSIVVTYVRDSVSPTSSLSSEPSSDAQVPSALSAQVSNPTPDTDGSSTTSSKPSSVL